MNFGKILLDEPIKRKRTVRDNKFYLVPLPEPLKPTPYVPPKPTPKPRIKKQAPIALPRNQLPKKVREKVKKLIDEITPYYSSEAISQFKKNLKFIQKAEIIQKETALKDNNNDPLIQLAETRLILKEMLEIIKRKEKRIQIKYCSESEIKKRNRRRKQKTEDIYQEPYFSSKTIAIINEYEINKKLEVAEEEILEIIAKWLSEGSQWAVDEVLHHYSGASAREARQQSTMGKKNW